MDSNGYPDIPALVNALRGLHCWYVSTGGAAGSTFQLALGKKVPRPVPLQNQAHSDEYRNFEGEVGLLVWCAWRLDGSDGPLSSWGNADDHVQPHLGKLVGAVIESAEVIPPAWELTIRFFGDLTLRVFCDHVPPEPSLDNWDLFLPAVTLCAGPGGRWQVEIPNEPAVAANK